MGQKHSEYLSGLLGNENIFVLSKQENIPFASLNSISQINKLDPDYIVISSETSSHVSYIKEIETRVFNKVILVEKPLFAKYEDFHPKNNTYFVGYNLRFHPLISSIRDEIREEKVISFEIVCNSYLPDWRRNIHYSDSSSSSISKGGGVLLDLSHELDYLRYIFGDTEHLYSKSIKVSDLKINTDDYLILVGETKEKALFTVNLNYFSKREIRKVTIETDKRTIMLDLLDSRMVSYFSDKEPIEILKNYSVADTYIQQHKAILQEDFSQVCSYQDGLKVMKMIDQIQNFEK